MLKKLNLSCIYILLFTGCSMLNDDEVCTSIGYPGIVLEAIEIETGEPAKNFFVTAREGAYIDSLFITDGINMSANLVIGRTGNFEVTVGGDKYVTWNKKNVTVSSDGCHPVTVFKEVALESIE